MGRRDDLVQIGISRLPPSAVSSVQMALATGHARRNTIEWMLCVMGSAAAPGVEGLRQLFIDSAARIADKDARDKVVAACIVTDNPIDLLPASDLLSSALKANL